LKLDRREGHRMPLSNDVKNLDSELMATAGSQAQVCPEKLTRNSANNRHAPRYPSG
jgi:hypothetical protein